jgi:hypothetical protein
VTAYGQTQPNLGFHLMAYFVAIGQTVDTDVPAISDQIIPINNSHFIPEQDINLWAAYAVSPNLTRAKINTPTFRQITPTHILPIGGALAAPTNPNVMEYLRNPIKIPARQEIQIQATSSLGAGTENCYAALIAGERYYPPPVGDVYTLRGTGTTTLTAQVWTDVPITWDSNVPPGYYAVVGADAQSATGIFFRMIFDNQYFRPGFLAKTSLTNKNHYYAYLGKLGTWGTFRSTSLPRFQFLANAGDTAETVFMQFVRVQTVGPMG